MCHSCWLQIKQTIKLCDNDLSSKRDQPGYNPAYTYDFCFKALIHNVNEMTYQAGLNQRGDETLMGHGRYSEPGSGLTSRIMNKPGITKGIKTVLISDVHRNRPRAYLHRHKVYEGFPNHIIEKWTSSPDGQEVRRVLERLKPLIEGETSNGRR